MKTLDEMIVHCQKKADFLEDWASTHSIKSERDGKVHIYDTESYYNLLGKAAELREITKFLLELKELKEKDS